MVSWKSHPLPDSHVQDVIAVRARAKTQMPRNPVNTHYFSLLHITAYMTIIEPCILARIMNNQVWFQAHLRNTIRKGGCLRFAHHLHPWKAACGMGWRSRSAITVAVTTAPIAKTTTSPALIQAELLESTASCTSWIPGHWAGPAASSDPWTY